MDKRTQRAIKKYPHRAVDIAQSYDWKQVMCKLWLHDELKQVNLPTPNQIYIAGGWFGNQIIPQLLDVFPLTPRIKLHDIDEEAVKICRNIFFKETDVVRAGVQDSTEFEYRHMLINTSCEHMRPLNVKPGTYVVLQSNNYRTVEDHINCVDSPEELAEQYNVMDEFYSGSMEFEKYTRYMVIGRV